MWFEIQKMFLLELIHNNFTGCLQGEWQCSNGLCIPETRRCESVFIKFIICLLMR